MRLDGVEITLSLEFSVVILDLSSLRGSKSKITTQRPGIARVRDPQHADYVG